eukprot:TRINITY_DN13873_c0_g1_i2.p1 TRINITY_DN13873_c0_g1~~TRINITY_DN13873_c0_g1_i2.p1  ORF type:complete len:464 (+),score=26.19 TRINITY_DN13873_c0_g1_i2:72-1463(+)
MQEPNEKTQYAESPYRWVIVLTYSLVILPISINFFAFIPIASTIKRVYGVNDFMINSIPFIFAACFLIFNFPSAVSLQNYGLRRTLTAAAWLQVVGAGIIYFIDHSFWFALGGELLVAMGQPMILNAMAKVSVTWFSAKNRTFMTGVFSLIFQIGLLAESYLSSALVNEDEMDPFEVKRQINGQLLVHVVFTLTAAVVATIFYKEKPEIPPSPLALQQRDELKQGLRRLMKNKNFLLLLIGFSCTMGCCLEQMTIVAYYLSAYHVKATNAGTICAILNFTEMVGCLVCSWLCGKFRKFKIFLLGVTGASIIFYVGWLYSMQNTNLHGLVVLMTFLLGLFIAANFGSGLEWGCELAYPVSEELVAGIMNCSCNIIVLLMVPSISWFNGKQEDGLFGVNAILIGALVIGIVAFLPVKESPNGTTLNNKADQETVSHSYEKIIQSPHVLCVDTCLLYTSASPRDQA